MKSLLRARSIILFLMLSMLIMSCGANLEEGRLAYEFTGDDLNGNTIKLSDYRGKVVLLDFWSTWCAPCVAQFPDIRYLQALYKDRGFVVIGISLDTDLQLLRKFVKDAEVPWAQLCDGKGWDGEIPRIYKVDAIPTTFLIDRDGNIRARDLFGSRLEGAVKQLLDAPAEPK